MVLVKFKDDKGEVVESYIDGYLKENLDEIKEAVMKKDWDYLCIVSGIVGVGKSTLAQMICKYLDPTFTTKKNICFTAFGKEGLLERTSNGNKGQSYMLDESFSDLNTRVTRSPDFIAIMNHLQLIRQKGLFIVMCLPNFFDLSKGIAVFRANHLFVVYHDRYKRGYFAGFGKDEKRELYIKGNKYLDFNCVEPNFRSKFVKRWIADEKLYDKLKLEHLKSQFKKKIEPKAVRDTLIKNKLIAHLKEKGLRAEEIADIGGTSRAGVYNSLKK